jgi:CheY-like chemotaxis protein
MPRVLIIDDDDDLVQLLTILLKSWKYDVASACNPAEGQTVCREFKPDIILLDYHMPGNTGAHLFETFRRNQATAKTPIIFMSAVASGDEVLREVDEADLAVFLPKPVHTPDLRQTMSELLAAAKAAQ